MSDNELEVFTRVELQDRGVEPRRLLGTVLGQLDTDPNTVVLLFEVPVGDGIPNDVLGFEWNRQDCLNWLKA